MVGIVSALAALMLGPAGARGDLLQDVGRQVDNLTQGLSGGGGETPAPAPAPSGSAPASPAAAPAAPAAVGEGTVATVDVVPDSNESDGDAEEDVVAGRSHGEHDRGEHRGQVTILRIGLLDLEISVPSGEGESAHGPLEPIQAGLLDPICEGSQGMLCAEVLRANSSSSESGSHNAFSVTDLHVGGEDGIDVDVAESNGSVTSDESCRSAHGDSTVARIEIGGEQVANLFPSSSDSRSCRGEGAQSDEETALDVGIASVGASRTASTPPEAEESETGGNAAGQGTVAALDVVPDLDDGDANPEEDVVVGRSRGENADGEHTGEVTVLSVGPLDLSIGSLSEEGESASGPLEGLQSGLFDPICEATEGNLCLEVLRADSEAGESGSSGSFAVATAVLGGPEGLGVIVGESNGSESEDENCRRAHADATVAEVDAAGDPLVILFQSSADASACDGSEAETERDSTDAEVAGTGVPLPVDGCDDGTPNSTLSLGIADVTCNADTGTDGSGDGDGTAGGVRDSVAADVLPDSASGDAAGDADGASSGATVDAKSEDHDDGNDDGDNGDDGDDGDDGNVGSGGESGGGPDSSLGPGAGDGGTGSTASNDGSGGNLPFTGFDVFAALILAGLLLATGSVMRTIAHDFGSESHS